MRSRRRNQASPAPFQPLFGFPDRVPRDYGADPDSHGADVPRRDGISKEDLDTAVGVGARIADVVIVERASGDFVPAILFDGKDTWKVLRLRRYDASRAWRSLDAAHAFLRACGYNGDWALLREDSERIAGMPGITDL